MVTAELAACLPVLILVLGVALSAVVVGAARVQVQDAAREIARAAARGDAATGLAIGRRLAPGARAGVSTTGDDVVASVTATVTPLGGWLPSITVTARSVAALEPSGASP